MAKDALGAHARDELGITDRARARPMQAAIASAASFALGALLPLVTVAVAPLAWLAPAVAITSLAFLATLGGLAAHTGGASIGAGALRVTFWGALAMIITAAVGAAFGTAVG
jgi:VIT1/CCC1 family predicted Fe2+/Mn2+ transporter